ncbi:MAG: hypothetical protein A2V90_01205 [Gammaproteobacteria bacterium RBG_16_57_12]|nr:MAG: hypothetical protein A2V90_01205 [Gammaproteobacteria bacterium RBG_16_57_12]
MKTLPSLLILTLLSFSAGLPVMASDKDDDKDTSQDKRPYMEMAREHAQMSDNMMMMLKQTMAILKDLNNAPSDADKAQLGKMIGDLDAMMKRHHDMREKMMEQCRNNPDCMKGPRHPGGMGGEH